MPDNDQQPPSEIVHDLAIVGAGPIGIELHVLAKRAGLSVIHLEAKQIAHTISWYAPGTHFFSSPERIAIAGVPLATANQDKATREEYLAYLRSVVQQYALNIRTAETVTAAHRDPARATNDPQPPFAVLTSRRGSTLTHHTRNIALTIGDMHRPRSLNIPGEELPHVDHYLRDPHQYFNKRVLIVGGKNSAVEAAIRLYRIGADVTLAYRGDQFSERIKYWLRPEIIALTNSNRIHFLPQTTPVELTPNHAVLESPAGKRINLETDEVLLLTGYEQDPTLFQSLGINLLGEARAPQHNRGTMQTNVPGIFVAGTAVAGTQIAGVTVFIENAHVHCRKIVRAITGSPADVADPHFALPES